MTTKPSQTGRLLTIIRSAISLGGAAQRSNTTPRLADTRLEWAYRWAVPYVAGNRILDLGPKAHLTESLADHAKQVDRLAAPSTPTAGINNRPPKSAYSTGVAYRLPYVSQYFDVVVAFPLTDSPLDEHERLKEFRRVLKPGGCFLFSTPNTKRRPLKFPRFQTRMPTNTEFERQWAHPARELFDQVELCGLFEDETPHVASSSNGAAYAPSGSNVSDNANARLRYFVGHEDLAHCLELFAICQKDR